MRAIIVFHSVCGNDFCLAQHLKTALEKRQIPVLLRRVADPDLPHYQTLFAAAKEYADAISAVPLANCDELTTADLLVLASPTYFGNMSGAMKKFLDTTAKYYSTQLLKGKFLAAMTSSTGPGGGGDFCLDALLRFGQHAGCFTVPMPVDCQNLTAEATAYGINHAGGHLGGIRPDQNCRQAIEVWAQFMLEFIKK